MTSIGTTVESPTELISVPDAVAGAILGCAIGDALGLPYEGLSRRRGVRLLGEPSGYRFLFGRGMVSDDTEHTCMTAQSLCEHPDDPEAFARALGRRLRWWLAFLPAGIGLATLRSIVRLWVGFGPTRSGIFSAGNGPAMRSAVLGAAIDDLNVLRRFIRVSSRLTHTDPKAETGAFAIALAAWCARRGLDHRQGFFHQYRTLPESDASTEFRSLLSNVEASLAEGETTEQFALQSGNLRGISGYVYHTVPICLHAWLSHPRDHRTAVMTVIRCGGDTDTTAAIVGAIVGTAVGRSGIPAEWLARLCEWPRTVRWMEGLAACTGTAAAEQRCTPPPELASAAVIARNLLFLVAVLSHGVRRCFPPY